MARLIQPIAVIPGALRKGQPLQMQPSTTPAGTESHEHSDNADGNSLLQNGNPEHVDPVRSLPVLASAGSDVVGLSARPLSTHEIDESTKLVTFSGLKDKQISSVTAHLQNIPSAKSSSGVVKSPPPRTNPPATSRFSRLFSKPVVVHKPTQSNVVHSFRHTWSANAAFVLVWNSRSMSILNLQTRRVNVQDMSGIQLAAMGSELCAIVCSDQSVRTSMQTVVILN